MNKKVFTLLAASLVMGSSAYAQCPQEGATAVEKVTTGNYYYLQYYPTTQTTGDPNADPYFAITKSSTGADSIVVIPTTALAAKGDSAIWQTFKLDGTNYQFQNKATGNYFSLNADGSSLSKFGWNFPSTSSGWQLAATSNYLNYQVQVGTVVDSVYMEQTASKGVNVYPTSPGWVKLTADELNAYYSDFFQMFDKSATSETAQAQASHAAFESKFHADTIVGANDPTTYQLNVLGSNKYLNVDTIYYNRIGLIDSMAQLGGHILSLDTISTAKSDSSYLFTIWKQLVSDSLAVQVYGVPRIAESGDTFASTASKDSSNTKNGWITLSSYDAGYNSTALTASVGCFGKNMPNPSFSLTKGQGKQIEAGYYWIYDGLTQDTMLVAGLSTSMEDEEWEWTPTVEGKAWVAAAQWYVPETSYYPSIFNRESTYGALTNGLDKTAQFYEVIDADGNVVPNAFEVIGASGIDTITMIPIPSAITEDIYLGYKNFADTQAELDVMGVYFQFNTVLSPNVALVTTQDSLLSVSTTIDQADAVMYKMVPVDTFSIGADTLRAVAYKFYTLVNSSLKSSAVDTVWLSSSAMYDRMRSSIPAVTYGERMYNTTDESKAGIYLIRATYNEGLYQIFEVYNNVNQIVYPSAERQAMIVSGTHVPNTYWRDLDYQISVAASTAEMYSNQNILDFNGLWSFLNPLTPEYATLTPGHVTISSSQNTSLAISVNDAAVGVLKGVGELKAEFEADNFKLFMDCVDTDTVKPLYMISTQQTLPMNAEMETQGIRYFMNTVAGPTSAPYQNALVTPADSLGFAPALLANDSLYAYDVAKNVVSKTPSLAATSNAYTYAFRINAATPEAYFIEAQLDGSYLSQINGILTTRDDFENALLFVVTNTSAPTANEGVTVATVKVVAGEGVVTIAGAAGKKVTLSNILGQTVATQILSSDNATIAAPRGVVVVAVEGEEAVKAIVK